MSNVRIQDDLYEYVNGDFLKNAVIPADRPTTGGFSELDQGVEKTLMADFSAFANGEKTTKIKEMNYAIELYKKYIDINSRNELGLKPILNLLNEVKNVKTIEELNEKAYDLSLKGVDLPFNYGVTVDMADASKYAFVITGPQTILPDTSYYSSDNEAGKQLLEVWKEEARFALSKTNLTSEEIEEFIENAIYYDSLIAKSVKSQLEWADYTKNHNPFKLEEVVSYLKPFDFKSFINKIYPNNEPEIIVSYDPRAMKEFTNYFNEQTFKGYISLAYINVILKYSPILSEELVLNSTLFSRKLMGVESCPVLEKRAYKLVSSLYSDVVGLYYGETYFGPVAKKDITKLVENIIDTYKVRVSKNDILEDATKEKAIEKLNTIKIKMGYPDFVPHVYSKFIVNASDSLFDAYSNILKERTLDELNKLYKEVDRSEWGMPGHMVNACYNPSSNDITFPAAILQKPFYSLDQTYSENLGGIGVVIGHEISHAFDNNGAQFDSLGNLKNWWTESDYKKFQDKTQEMIDEFDGIEIYNGKVSGELVVSENIADNGGMAVAIEIMHNTKNTDFKEFFISWARIWCMKAKDEYLLYLLTNDVHAPAKLRANIQVRNFDEWYETFGVKNTDKMYIEPNKRVRIW